MYRGSFYDRVREVKKFRRKGEAQKSEGGEASVPVPVETDQSRAPNVEQKPVAGAETGAPREGVRLHTESASDFIEKGPSRWERIQSGAQRVGESIGNGLRVVGDLLSPLVKNTGAALGDTLREAKYITIGASILAGAGFLALDALSGFPLTTSLISGTASFVGEYAPPLFGFINEHILVPGLNALVHAPGQLAVVAIPMALIPLLEPWKWPGQAWNWLVGTKKKKK